MTDIPLFICPKCGGEFCGRDVGGERGKPVALPTMRCHDQFNIGCTWHGVWPPKQAQETP